MQQPQLHPAPLLHDEDYDAFVPQELKDIAKNSVKMMEKLTQRKEFKLPEIFQYRSKMIADKPTEQNN